MTTYRAGIVGLTGIAAAPAESEPRVLGGVQPHSHAASYAAVPEVEVVAICELRPELFASFDRDWAGRWPRVAKYTDYHQMLERERLDLLSVVTPDHLHADIVVDAARGGVKGIFCEKPMATTLTDADRMIAAVAESGSRMIVDHSRRWFADYVRVGQLLGTGALGRVARVNAAMGGPRAMLFRNGTHLIDAIAMFVPAEPVQVVAHLDPGHESYGPRYAGRGGRDPAHDPGATALITFDNGVIASLHCSKTITPEHWSTWEVTLYCEHGVVRIREPGGVEVTTSVADPFGSRYGTAAAQQLAIPQYRWSDGAAAVRELIEIVEDSDPARQGQCSPRDGRRVLAIMLAILQSASRGGTPVHAPFRDAE